MDQERITSRLTELSELYAQRDLIDLDMMARIKAAMPEEVGQAIANIQAAHMAANEELTQSIHDLEADVKSVVVAHGSSVKGEHIHAVYNKPRTSWDTKGIAGYAVAHPEVATFRKTGKPSVSLRRR